MQSTCWDTPATDSIIKDVHRRQKLTTDFVQTFRVDYFGCEYLNFEEKVMLTVVSKGSFFKGLDNKIIGFVHIFNSSDDRIFSNLKST